MEEKDKFLTQEDVENIVQNYLFTRDWSLIKYKIEPLPNAFDGLIGEQYFIKIDYKYNDKIENFSAFFKVLNGSSQTMFEISKEIKAYEKEEFFYMKLVKEYEKFGIEDKFFPKCYFCKPYVIVLENLCLENYQGVHKKKPLDFEHCLMSLELIAKFHASAIIYEQKTSQDLLTNNVIIDHIDLLKDVFSKDHENGATKFFKFSIIGLCMLIDLIPENHISAEDFKARLNKKVGEECEDLNKFTNSILHRDLWAKNFLFKYENNRLLEGKLLDFQTLGYGPVALDVEQFLMTTTRRKFRAKHHHDLIEHYFNIFKATIQSHGLSIDEILTLENLFQACEEMKVQAKIQAIIDRCVTFLSDENYKKIIHDESIFAKFLFEDRGKYIVESFKDNESFRELILEDMLELRELLFR